MTQNITFANLVKFYSKLVEFRVAEKYSDVTIKCKGKFFKCHRVTLATASTYFDSQFSFGKMEKHSRQTIVLNGDVGVEVFELVLQFMYTGNVTINSRNVYWLLRASDYFGLTGMTDVCVEFVRSYKMSVEATFDVLKYALEKGMLSLMNLVSGDIAKQLRIFARSKKFMELSLDELSVVLNMVTMSAIDNNELILGFVFDWVSHCPASRIKYVTKFARMFPVANLITKDNRLAIDPSELVADITRPRPAICGYDQVPEMSREKAILKGQKYLNVFVKKFEDDTVVRVFPVRKKNRCQILGQSLRLPHKDQRLRTVAFDDDHLYCMHFSCVSDAENVATSIQSFCLYNSGDLREQLILKDPPIVFNDLSLCATKNYLYACNKSPFESTGGIKRSSTSSTTTNKFCDKEIQSGVYFYNCYLNDWFPVGLPFREKPFYNCCAVTHNEILYLFGSDSPYTDKSPTSTVRIQAYDHRKKNWLTLPSSESEHFAQMNCCVNSSNRIYVHTSPGTMIFYDITAGKWQSTLPLMNRTTLYRQLVSYSSEIWALGGSSFDGSFSDLGAEIYNNNVWEFTRIIIETAKKYLLNDGSGIVLDAVVFK